MPHVHVWSDDYSAYKHYTVLITSPLCQLLFFFTPPPPQLVASSLQTVWPAPPTQRQPATSPCPPMRHRSHPTTGDLPLTSNKLPPSLLRLTRLSLRPPPPLLALQDPLRCTPLDFSQAPRLRFLGPGGERRGGGSIAKSIFRNNFFFFSFLGLSLASALLLWSKNGFILFQRLSLSVVCVALETMA